MPGFIATGYVDPGHRARFTYPVINDETTCVARCECGWIAQIRTYPQPWAMLESKLKFARHLRSAADAGPGPDHVPTTPTHQ
jgi:hypothetical protein